MKTLFLAGALLLALPAGAAAFYCGTNLITEGDRIEIVVAKCGEPMSWRQGGQGLFHDPPVPLHAVRPHRTRPRFHPSPQQFVLEVVDREILTYNCGPGALIQVLTFWNGRLIRMETAGYGFGPYRCP